MNFPVPGEKSAVDRDARRVFLKQAAWVAAAAAAPAFAVAAEPAAEKQRKGTNLIWGNLLHLGLNMWCDREVPQAGNLTEEERKFTTAQPYLRFDESLWKDLARRMARVGINMVVIDLGEGVCYESHPEIAVKGAWTPAKLREELAAVPIWGWSRFPS